jgi:hypothetical protein
MNFLDEDDRNAAIELLKANALATANNNSLHTTIREEQYLLKDISVLS